MTCPFTHDYVELTWHFSAHAGPQRTKSLLRRVDVRLMYTKTESVRGPAQWVPTLKGDLARMHEVHDALVLCSHCGTYLYEHAKGRCLFSFTTYDPGCLT